MVKSYYIYGCSVYYIYGQILLHLWFVDLLHLWLKVINLWLVLHLWSIFITFMVGITFMVFITFMGDTNANEVEQRICIRFGSCEVRRLNLASVLQNTLKRH